jgi:hypothetical protein
MNLHFSWWGTRQTALTNAEVLTVLRFPSVFGLLVYGVVNVGMQQAATSSWFEHVAYDQAKKSECSLGCLSSNWLLEYLGYDRNLTACRCLTGLENALPALFFRVKII